MALGSLTHLKPVGRESIVPVHFRHPETSQVDRKYAIRKHLKTPRHTTLYALRQG